MSDFELEAAAARAYAEALRGSLHNMAVATKLHGLPPDAEALLSAISQTFEKAYVASVQAGVVLLTEKEKVKLGDEARASAARDGVEEWGAKRVPGE